LPQLKYISLQTSTLKDDWEFVLLSNYISRQYLLQSCQHNTTQQDATKYE
jgi:hypothetical protein